MNWIHIVRFHLPRLMHSFIHCSEPKETKNHWKTAIVINIWNTCEVATRRHSPVLHRPVDFCPVLQNIQLLSVMVYGQWKVMTAVSFGKWTSVVSRSLPVTFFVRTNSDKTNLSRITYLFVASLSNRIVDRNGKLQGPEAALQPHINHRRPTKMYVTRVRDGCRDAFKCQDYIALVIDYWIWALVEW